MWQLPCSQTTEHSVSLSVHKQVLSSSPLNLQSHFSVFCAVITAVCESLVLMPEVTWSSQSMVCWWDKPSFLSSQWCEQNGTILPSLQSNRRQDVYSVWLLAMSSYEYSEKEPPWGSHFVARPEHCPLSSAWSNQVPNHVMPRWCQSQTSWECLVSGCLSKGQTGIHLSQATFSNNKSHSTLWTIYAPWILNLA